MPGSRIPPSLPGGVVDIPVSFKERLRAGYDAMDAKAYGFEPSDEDFEYTWGWFEDVRTLYYTADRLGRHVLFSADQ